MAPQDHQLPLNPFLPLSSAYPCLLSLTLIISPPVMSSSDPSDPRDFVFAEPAPLGQTVFLGVYLGVYFALLCFVVVQLIRHRRSRFIIPRNISTLIPFQLVSFSSCVVFSVSIILGKPAFCNALDALYIAIPVFAMHFNLNTPELVFMSDLNSLKVARAQTGARGWVFTIIRLCALPYKILYMAVVAGGQIGLYLGLRFGVHIAGDCNRASQLAYSVNLLAFLVILLYFMVRLGRLRDPFHMKLENNIGFPLCGAQIFMMITYPIVPSIYSDGFDFRWVMVLYTPVAVFVNGLFPVLLTFPRFRGLLERTAVSAQDQKDIETKGTIFALKQGVDVFQAVLNHPDLCEAFTRFTESEWSVENVLFYKAVEDYKRRAEEGAPGLQERAQHLVDEYVANTAPLEVNLDHRVKAEILRILRTGATANMFDEAHSKIYSLMEEDSFKKWQLTQGFKEALERVVSSRNSSGSKSGNISGNRSGVSKSHSRSQGRPSNSESRDSF